MRKRAQRKSKPVIEKPKHKIQKKPEPVEKRLKIKKNGWVAITLISIFLIVLFFNSFFNISSDVTVNTDGEGLEKYYLSGPDPYYNMRLVKVAHETGKYPYYYDDDPLLNYPLGASGGRPPLLNMASLGFSRLLTPFMDEVDAIGRSMQFIPALFGALIVFPVYFIGKTIFNKKAGLLAAFFLAIIPVHIGSGHGSAYSLFDHDSLNLLLFFLTFLFLILSIKEKNTKKSILYAILGGVPLAGLSMTWVQAQFIYSVIGVYAIVQMFFDIFLNKIDIRVFRSSSIVLLTGFFVSLPVIATRSSGFPFDTSFAICFIVTLFGFIYYFFKVKRVPWTLSLPAVFGLGAVGIVVLYGVHIGSIKISLFSSLSRLSDIIFGSGIYGKKVSITIAEANTYQISNTVMSFGPAIYWVGWAGFIALIYFYYKDKMRRDYLFIITLFIVDLWLTSTAGRFVNDMVPVIAILAGGITWFFIEKIDYKQMIRNIKNAGGGIHGLRRGVKILHIMGILFIAFVVILPNLFLALDAAVPSKLYQEENEDGDLEWVDYKTKIFGEEHASAFGLSVLKEKYWVDAFKWLSEQDVYDGNSNITLADTEKPAFISWWDYGFYEVAVGEHPTVADNFQDGIPPAGNFHTATGEKEAVTIWIVRLLEGIKADNDGKITDNVKDIFRKYLDNETADNITRWVEDSRQSPSYNQPIDEEYHKYFKEGIETRNLYVGAQWAENALYHDMVDVLVNKNNTALSDDEITWFYHDIQEASNYSIRYYGVEGYDKQIFNIFAFLSDKSLTLLGAPGDEFISVVFSGQKYRADGTIEETYTNEPLETYLDLTDKEKRYVQITNTNQVYNDVYFDTMFYKTYIGPYNIDQSTGQKTAWQDLYIPCINMKHFYAEYISNFTNPHLQYRYNGKPAVVIAKYYEGAYINGSVMFNNETKANLTAVVVKNLTYYENVDGDLEIPIEHDRDTTSSDGVFNVIAGAGSYIKINKKIGQSSMTIKNITFNGDSEYAPISEADAMRKTNSNYERLLDITIEPANIEGYVYDDINGDKSFNKSVDMPLSDITVIIREIVNVNQDGSFDVGDEYFVTTDENGHYNKSGVYPGIYRIIFEDDDGYIVDLTDKSFYEGNNTYNVIKRKSGSIEGVVYYDESQDDEYDSGEELEQAVVILSYDGEEIRNTTTDSDGSYKFKDLTAGWAYGDSNINEYIIRASKLPEYEFVGSVFAEENTTKTLNVSMDLTPVSLSGNATYMSEGIEGVTIMFNKNNSVDLNTAEYSTTNTDENGEYSLELQPGSYNVTLSKSIDQGFDETTIYESNQYNIVLSREIKKVTRDFTVMKKTVNVSGDITYGTEKQNNVTVLIMPVNLSLDVNSAQLISKENGRYSAEIMPLEDEEIEYNITATAFNLTGDGYVYSATEFITITEEDIATGVSKNIVLERKEQL